MKTREQIIEDYFRARGAEKKMDSSMDPHGKWDDDVSWYLQDRWLGFSLPDIATNFNLFREHVIEVMAERGFAPTIGSSLLQEDVGKLFFVWSSDKKKPAMAEIIDNQWLLAAIEAATRVLRG